MKPFTLDIETTSGETRIRISGLIDETARLSPLLQRPEGQLIFDLSGIERVTSIGIRCWVTFVRALSEAGKTFVLERCSVPVVTQLNIVPSFRGQGTVRSVYAPFFCARCNAQRTELFEVQPDLAKVLATPLPCQSCSGEMELDDIPERFLAFLGR